MGLDRIALDHGSGGAASHELISKAFVSRLDNEALRRLDDSAEVRLGGHRLAVTTDSYVVDPIFFPGGDIGSLAVHGTVNDLAMQGAAPLYLTLGLILEEGLPMTDLTRIMDSVAEASRKAGVQVIAGDTKVVPKGHADKIFINTSGIGVIPEGIDVSAHNAKPGDAVLINGSIGDHGMAILTRREGLDFETPIVSDSAPLHALASDLLQLGPDVHVLRDPTRGGVATALNEIAHQSGVTIRLSEAHLPIHPAVAAACELLGLDPLYVANEGKCLAFVAREHAALALAIMQRNPLGQGSRIIGEVTAQQPPKVLLRTRVGGTRILAMLTGEQLPRIC
jgi:hydrogenase expression/formation protein HypE